MSFLLLPYLLQEIPFFFFVNLTIFLYFCISWLERKRFFVILFSLHSIQISILSFLDEYCVYSHWNYEPLDFLFFSQLLTVLINVTGCYRILLFERFAGKNFFSGSVFGWKKIKMCETKKFSQVRRHSWRLR